MSLSANHKAHLLVVVSRFPYPLEKGDKLRSFYQLKELSKEYRITLVAITDKNITQEQLDVVNKYCDKIVLGKINTLSKIINIAVAFINGRPFQTGYFYRHKIKNKINSIVKDDRPKYIYCQLIRTSEYVKNIHHISKTIDYMDALSSGIKRRINKQPFYLKWIYKIEAKKLSQYECHIFDYFENHTIISEQDRKLIQHPNQHEITCIPNGIDDSFYKPMKRNEEFDFVFVGNLSYPPNIDAVKYIIHDILPALDSPTFLVSGATPHSSIVKLCDSTKGVSLTGWVDDIRSSYVNGKIFLAPMMIGTGMQNKLLEAMALQTPCITTSLANNAIKAKSNVEILVGDTKDELIQHCKDLLTNLPKRNEIGENAHNMVKEHFSWKHSTTMLSELFMKAK